MEAALVSFSRADRPALLESSLAKEGYEQFTILSADPVTVIEFDPASGACPFSALAKQMAAYPSLTTAANNDFFCPGGWIGYFTYESGMGMERIPVRRESGPALPGVRFGLYDAMAVFNHAQRVSLMHRGQIIFQGTPEEVRRDKAAQRIYLGEQH